MNTPASTSFAEAISLQGVELQRNALIFSGANSGDLYRVARFLREVDSSLAWWLGDALNALHAHALARAKTEGRCAASAKMDADASARAFAEMTAGGDCSNLLQAAAVARFFPPEARGKLSWRHHEVAMVETRKDLNKALAFLSGAEERAISYSQLRAEMRSATATKTKSDGHRIEPYPITKFCGWLRREPFATYDAARASGVALDLEEVAALIGKALVLLRKAKTKGNARNGT